MRLRAMARFLHCDRLSSTATVTIPLRARRPRFRSIWVRKWSGTEGLDPRSKDSSARLAARLACWPPGPPAVSKRHVNSAVGITMSVRTSSGSFTMAFPVSGSGGPSLRADR